MRSSAKSHTEFINPASLAHVLQLEQLTLDLGTDLRNGLGNERVRECRDHFGPNTLPSHKRQSPLVRFLLQFHSPLIYVLLTAIAVTLLIGHVVDAVIIGSVVAVNAVVGFLQEHRASQALEALASVARTESTAVRGGDTHRIDSRELVPGDLILLESGDKVPADIRLTEAHEMRLDESALTGESIPVTKVCGLLPVETPLADRVNMAWSGTLVVSGSGRGLVVSTGLATEIGRIHELVGEAQDVATPLTKRLVAFSKVLTIAILALACLTLLVGLARGESLAEMVTAAVALAVGAIPEGLPAAVTITLAIGVSRMAHRNAIIRRLPAAETLGSTTVICTDKTGTLTQNRMTVQHVFSEGVVQPIEVAPTPHALLCLAAGVLCNNATLTTTRGGEIQELGDPTEVALLIAAQRAGIDIGAMRAEGPRIDELPFSSEARLMATLHRFGDQEGHLLVVKGAAEAVLELCEFREIPSFGIPYQQTVDRQVAAFGENSLRVLAFASCRVPQDWRFESGSLRNHPLTFLGLQAMADPPRPEAIRAVAACRSAGISVKMITGDHANTARAVAYQIGLHNPHKDSCVVLTGDEMARKGPELTPTDIENVDVFARVTAEQKYLIVRYLQAAGHIVAMTGDGVNDAPALRQSDIGVAMGHSGTDVAKEASDIILTDDNFATIEAAVEEGRAIFDNLTKFIAWTLPTNIGEGLVILVAIISGFALPILPVQILWINMTTAVLLGITLGFEPAESDIMKRPPRQPRQPILTAALVRRIMIVGMLMLIGAFTLFEWTLSQGAPLEQARTVVVNAFIGMEVAYLFNCRVMNRSAMSAGFLSNRLLLAGVAVMGLSQLCFTYLPIMNLAFQTMGLTLLQWLVVALLGFVMFFMVELVKLLEVQIAFRCWHRRSTIEARSC